MLPLFFRLGVIASSCKHCDVGRCSRAFKSS
nr:MAG TPA: hypothetical protein [Caudoviricetes sp.]